MQKFILDQTHLSQLVFDNKYPVDQKTKFISRCIDGRYLKDNLPALAFPGADAGELALILATARNYGFTVDKEKAYKSLIEVIGGEKFFQLHTDSHATNGIAAGCGHIKQLGLTPEDYFLTQEEVDFIKEKSITAVKNGAVETLLHGEHGEGAVVYIRGNYGIYPQYALKLEDEREVNTSIFIYHTGLVNERHRVLSNILLKNKAVKLPEGCDEEWLYDALFDTAEIQTLETVRRLAKGLPIYQVEFDSEGSFKIKEMGTV